MDHSVKYKHLPYLALGIQRQKFSHVLVDILFVVPLDGFLQCFPCSVPSSSLMSLSCLVTIREPKPSVIPSGIMCFVLAIALWCIFDELKLIAYLSWHHQIPVLSSQRLNISRAKALFSLVGHSFMTHKQTIWVTFVCRVTLLTSDLAQSSSIPTLHSASCISKESYDENFQWLICKKIVKWDITLLYSIHYTDLIWFVNYCTLICLCNKWLYCTPLSLSNDLVPKPHTFEVTEATAKSTH